MPINDKFFADTNIVVYAFDKDLAKKGKAIEIIERKPVISSQVIIESLNICMKKLKIPKNDAFRNAKFLLSFCEYTPNIELSTFTNAFTLVEKYGYTHLDSLIIATALQTQCTILYSEDMQHNQIIHNKLKIINPFII